MDKRKINWLAPISPAGYILLKNYFSNEKKTFRKTLKSLTLVGLTLIASSGISLGIYGGLRDARDRIILRTSCSNLWQNISLEQRETGRLNSSQIIKSALIPLELPLKTIVGQYPKQTNTYIIGRIRSRKEIRKEHLIFGEILGARELSEITEEELKQNTGVYSEESIRNENPWENYYPPTEEQIFINRF
jgi:hypothetical protein